MFFYIASCLCTWNYLLDSANIVLVTIIHEYGVIPQFLQEMNGDFCLQSIYVSTGHEEPTQLLMALYPFPF